MKKLMNDFIERILCFLLLVALVLERDTDRGGPYE
jgi:hypothetical protein